MASAADEIRTLTVRRRLADMGADVSACVAAIETSYADLAEALLAGAHALGQEARQADFAPPPYPPAGRRSIELTLSQTREMKFRLGPPGSGRCE